MIKEEYMRRAIELAKRATGFTNPNPLVGVVIVKEDRIIARVIMKNAVSFMQREMHLHL